MVSLAMEYFLEMLRHCLKKCCLDFLLWFKMFCWEWEGLLKSWWESLISERSYFLMSTNFGLAVEVYNHLVRF